jgi:putative transferase (TIGR04331 family)
MPGTLEAVDRNTAELLCGLPSHTDLMIRLNPANNGLRAQVKWQLLAPQATFDDLRENVFRRFEQYGLVLHNYIGTTFLEALAYDIPTVAFYDVTTYAYRAEAQPLVETLERVGILHRSGSAAAAFVAGLAGNVAGWWHGVEVQEARNKFVSRYANFSYNWKFAWEQELSRLAG